MIPMQAGMIETAKIKVRLVNAGDIHGMAMTKIKVSITTEADIR
jgi:hypothetical protein